MDRYAVIGNPISHSLSPTIHAMFARAEGEALEYSAMLVPQGEFAARVGEFFAHGASGANVTLPFKVEAFAFADSRSERASVAGAANFLARRSDGIHADNTDGAGLVNDITRNHRVELGGKRVLLVGAGGATRGVLAPLLAARPGCIVLANRTVGKARELAERFGAGVQAVALDAIPEGPFDVVINGTSSATRGERLELSPSAFGHGTFAYDMAYGPAAKPFMQLAASHGAQVSDGLGMLVEQAAESFHLWRGKRPDTAAVMRELRAKLG